LFLINIVRIYVFHPASYYTGRTIQIAAGIILLILFILAGINLKRRNFVPF